MIETGKENEDGMWRSVQRLKSWLKQLEEQLDEERRRSSDFE